MGNQKKLLLLVCVVLCGVLGATLVFAAEDRPNRRGPGQGRGGFDRAAMQERMMEMLQGRLGTTDEEWTIIKPRLSEVMDLSQSGGRGMMRMFGRGRGGRQQEQGTESLTDPVEIAADDLQKTLDKEAPSAAEIKAKLDALRGAKEKNKQKLVAAQQKLREVLSLKQEATLVMMGMLE